MAYFKGRGKSIASISGFPPHPRGKPKAGTAPRTGRSLPSPRGAGKPVVSCHLTT